jgi:hypothetical protein
MDRIGFGEKCPMVSRRIIIFTPNMVDKEEANTMAGGGILQVSIMAATDR